MSFMPHMVDAVIDTLFEAQRSESLRQLQNETSHRKHFRFPFHGRAAAVVFPSPSTPQEEPTESEVLTTDISRSGLSLLHQQELYPGQQVLLQLNQGPCSVEVCWCCQVWPGLYIVGCRFVDATWIRSSSPNIPGEIA